MFPNSFAPVSVALTSEGGDWGPPVVLDEAPVLPIRAVGLHYGQVAFEALRAAPVDGRLQVFRPELHHRRLARSLARLSMPPVPGATFGAALGRLLESLVVPPALEPGSFLYLRPLVVGVDEDWSMSGSVRFELHVLAGWTQPAFHGVPRVRARVEVADRRALAGPGGIVKVPANYGSSMTAQHRAQAIGAHTVLWLAPGSRTVEEFTSMNALVLTDRDVLHAPAPGAGVLDGVVRRSVLELAARAGLTVTEAPVAWPTPEESAGRIAGLFASATAAGLVPVAGVKEVDADGRVHTWRPASGSDAADALQRIVGGVLGGSEPGPWWADPATLATWPYDDATEAA